MSLQGTYDVGQSQPTRVVLPADRRNAADGGGPGSRRSTSARAVDVIPLSSPPSPILRGGERPSSPTLETGGKRCLPAIPSREGPER